jgi:hypothetical protein
MFLIIVVVYAGIFLVAMLSAVLGKNISIPEYCIELAEAGKGISIPEHCTDCVD